MTYCKLPPFSFSIAQVGRGDFFSAPQRVYEDKREEVKEEVFG